MLRRSEAVRSDRSAFTETCSVTRQQERRSLNQKWRKTSRSSYSTVKRSRGHQFLDYVTTFVQWSRTPPPPLFGVSFDSEVELIFQPPQRSTLFADFSSVTRYCPPVDMSLNSRTNANKQSSNEKPRLERSSGQEVRDDDQNVST